MNFVINPNSGLTDFSSILWTVLSILSLGRIKIHYSNYYINECISKLSQVSCIFMWDNTLILWSFENTKIGIWIMGESTLTHTCLSVMQVFLCRRHTHVRWWLAIIEQKTRPHIINNIIICSILWHPFLSCANHKLWILHLIPTIVEFQFVRPCSDQHITWEPHPRGYIGGGNCGGIGRGCWRGSCAKVHRENRG